mmetsp:Transcript_18329/g.55176  ORF Transcript_18329/g.55176 Transcript_18329/m.55176 type:complete len:681 (-) Transcript_18329:766-2808(-)|eukprot:CAMPEP_0206149874 /NCGR_PEP_ID=MMETSP1473-20131121/37995_1 /ASSEMBLY_ACC=CAM_ASM_001109 /TAXON_ID=1461547 /ORGANISM="Stichococcus sp, Strain RCC1054" /LENGTH=680 /DNA_ID=CAMNT_0053547357 /DNA_START=3395 /DNA_END=5437 /DNA_ORIENTATION=+
MSLIEFRVQTPYHLFQTWTEEVENVIKNTYTPQVHCYLVYTDFYDEHVVYVYLPAATVAGALQILPQDVDRDAQPVHCVPAIDMSTSTLREFIDTDSEIGNNLWEYAVEDITLGDALEQTSRGAITLSNNHLLSHVDTEIRSMYMFVRLARCDPSVLLSYIKHALISRNFEDNLDVNIIPQKYTWLEAKSEMKRCNRSLYRTYKDNILELMLASALNDSRSPSEVEHKISGIAYELLSDTVVCCMNVLWCFVDGVWQEYSSDGYIWKFLTYGFIDFLSARNADTVVLNLMSVNIRSRIMKDIKMRLQDDNFHAKLDAKKHIVRMTNGIYDTRTETLSDPVPSDYVSVIAGVPYQPFDKKSHEVCKLVKILRMIFPDPDVFDFFLLSCSTFLEGYNSPKLFFIWWGTGNNAKTLVQSLVMKTFGDYCSTAPTSLVTGKRTESSNATPELCHVDKRLVVFLQEPNPDEKIKAGKMKEMTGNDSMYVRQLFKAGKTMVLKAKIVIVCNNILEIPGMDAAIRRRIMVVPFTSTFLDPSEFNTRSRKGTLEPNSQIIDVSVEKDLLSCKAAFMYLLCRRYSEWVNCENMSIYVPEVIKQVTNEYLTRNNYQLRFIRLYMVPTSGSYVTATEIYESFKEWFRKSYPGKKVQDFEKFTKEISEEGYKEDSHGVVHDVFITYNGEMIQ